MFATRTITYPAFGSPMPTRVWSDPNSKYKYGFNGKEKDDEINVDGGSYDFGARIYDSRLGRWLSLDPLMRKYADLSPYNYCNNSPFANKDCDGKDFELNIFIDNDGKPQIEIIADIYTGTEENTKEINAAVAQWTALNGTKIKFNNVEFNISFKMNVKQKNNLEAAKIASAGNSYSNVYGGSFKSDGKIAFTNTTITYDLEGKPQVTNDSPPLAVTENYNYIYYNTNFVTTITTGAIAKEFGKIEGVHIEQTTKGASPNCLAHEIGHLLLLNHNDAFTGGKEIVNKDGVSRLTEFNPNGVMASGCQTSPTKCDLITSLTESIKFFNNDNKYIKISNDAMKLIFPT